MPEDIVQKYGDIYVKTAAAVLGDQHPFLLEAIENHITKDSKPKSLLVIGPSKWVLPYSYDPERVGKIIGDGKLVLMDYTDEMLDGAIDFLKKIDFEGKSNLKIEEKKHIKVDPFFINSKTVSFVKGNLKDRLPFPDNSFNCIDATLVAHHVIPYLENLDNVAKELYRVLAPGGMLHYGTGDVDMDSESKLIQIINDLQEYFGKPVMIVDQRDENNSFITKAVLGSDGRIKTVNDATNYEHNIFITREGEIIIPTDSRDKLFNYFGQRGYKRRDISGRSVKIPLIDPSIDKKFVQDVKSFYSTICHRALTKGCEEDKLDKLEEAVKFEEANALKGTTEYYKSYEKIKSALQKAGFDDIDRKTHEMGPFYNIVASKQEIKEVKQIEHTKEMLLLC